MKIVVCIKQTPDSEVKVVIPDGGSWIDDSNVNYVLNPYDEFAVEEALKIQEKFGGEVIAVSLGPERAGKAIRTALAMGANSGIHLKCDKHLMGLSVAKALAGAIKPLEPDLVLLGSRAIDDDNMQIGPMMAELLDMPSANVITKLEMTESGGTAERDIEGGKEIIEFSLPAVVTAQKGLNEPRYASLKGIMMAKKKPLEIIETEAADSGIIIKKMEYPSERKECKIVGKDAGAVPELVRLLREEAKAV